MAVNIVAVMSLVVGLYILHRADKLKKNKEVYALAGLVAVLWSIAMLSGAYPNFGIMPLAFGLAGAGSLMTKGGTQTVFAAVAVLIFLTVVL